MNTTTKELNEITMMIVELNTIRKEMDILNSEGTILGLYLSKDQELILQASIRGDTKLIYFTTDRAALEDYAANKITLHELYMRSEDLLVRTVHGKEEKIAFKVNFDGQLQCGNFLYQDLAKGMKSRKFVKAFAY